MKSRIKQHIAALLAVLPLTLTLAGPASAAINLTDSWWNPAESGWGLFITHTDDTAGIGLFVHDAAGNPFHVTGGLSLIALANPGGWPVMQGTLYRTRGPNHAGLFDPALVTRQAVGQATFEPVSANEAIFTYTIDGQTVQKRVSRFTVALKDIGGDYRFVQRVNLQSNPGSVREYDSGVLKVTQDGNQIGMRFEGALVRCEYNGNYVQRGRYGVINGFYQCDSGTAGTFKMDEVELTGSGLAGKFTQMTGTTGFQRGGFTAVANN